MHGRQKGKGSGKRYRSVVFLRRTRPDGKAPRKPEEPEQTPRSTGRTARKKHKIFRVETSRYGVETQRIHRSGTLQARRREKARRGNRSLDYQDFNSDAEETAVLVADNRLAELSETSEDDLRKILSELDGIVDLELTGFSETEVELLLRDIGSEEVLEEDVPEVSENPLTNFGDVFEFGGHRLMCGDSTDPEQVKKTNGRKRRRYGFYGSALQRGLRRERTQNRKRQSRERLSRVPRKGHKKRLRIFRRRYLHLHVQFRNRHVAVGVP